MQDLTRIDDAVSDGDLAANEVLREAFAAAERVHLIGLVSDGGVHSSIDHLRALIELAAELEVPDLVLHCFTDGRDTAPTGGADYLRTVAEWCEQAGAGRIASVVGRYFAMDRDGRWDRIQQAYDLLVHGRAEHHADSGREAARAAYERDETDEFITPTTVADEGCIHAGDSVLCFNFRPDRMREITRALADERLGADGEELDRAGVVGTTTGGGALRLPSPSTRRVGPTPWRSRPQRPEVTLGAVLAAADARQLHVAETEKYPHVTYFFNGGEESPYEGEDASWWPRRGTSPPTTTEPEMSAAAQPRLL